MRGRIYPHRLTPRSMGAHSVEWTIISSAVDDVDMIALALESVLPEGVEIEYENVKSHHGALSNDALYRALIGKRIFVAPCHWCRKVCGIRSLRWVSSREWTIRNSCMPDSIFRFVAGEHVLASRARSRHSVKLRIKIECYPGQEIIDEATTLLSRYAELDKD